MVFLFLQAPDGMEMEAKVRTLNKETVQASAAPPALLCKNSCTCICHQRQPGMSLVWVPKEEEEKEKEERDRAGKARRQTKTERVPLRKEQTEKVEQTKFQQVLDSSTKNGKRQNTSESFQTTLGPSKFYHRSHWSTPIAVQSTHVKPGPKVTQDTPPPIPLRIPYQADKPGNQKEGPSSASPLGKVHPPANDSLPHRQLAHQSVKPPQPNQQRKPLSSLYSPQSKGKHGRCFLSLPILV